MTRKELKRGKLKEYGAEKGREEVIKFYISSNALKKDPKMVICLFKIKIHLINVVLS